MEGVFRGGNEKSSSNYDTKMLKNFARAFCARATCIYDVCARSICRKRLLGCKTVQTARKPVRGKILSFCGGGRVGRGSPEISGKALILSIRSTRKRDFSRK